MASYTERTPAGVSCKLCSLRFLNASLLEAHFTERHREQIVMEMVAVGLFVLFIVISAYTWPAATPATSCFRAASQKKGPEAECGDKEGLEGLGRGGSRAAEAYSA